MKEECVITHNKNIVLESFMKTIDFKNPNNRKEAVAKLDDFSNFLIKNQNNIKQTNNLFNAFFVTELVKYDVKELRPKVKKFFDLNIVNTDFCGSYTNLIEKPEFSVKPINSIKNYKTIEEVYENFKIKDNFNFTPFEEEEPIFKEEISQSLLTPKKIGRNDSCFCGSGKKYKKCCLN